MKRAVLLVAIASCHSQGSTLAIWNERPQDPKAQVFATAFPDGTNGTELVLGVLAAARAQEVASVSAFEIQVGPCVRAVTVPAANHASVAAAPETERIVFRARETAFTCRRFVKQELVPSGGGGMGEKKGLSDPQMQTAEECDRVPIDHVVMRYRYEVDHGFMTPDWREVKRWTGLELELGPPECGHPASNEVRAVFHAGRPPARPIERQTDRAAEVIALAQQAQAAAEANRAGEAAEVATRALATLSVADLPVDERLADAIGAVQFFAVEADVAAFLARRAPASIDPQWAKAVGADIDRIAQRYQRIGDLVRLPEVMPWMRRGAGQLAKLHRRVADWLDELGQFPAADIERAKAVDYERITSGAATSAAPRPSSDTARRQGQP